MKNVYVVLDFAPCDEHPTLSKAFRSRKLAECEAARQERAQQARRPVKRHHFEVIEVPFDPLLEPADA